MPLGGYGTAPTDLSHILADTDELILEQAHVTRIFPPATDLTCTFTAHANADTWSEWTEIQDSGANTLSSLVTSILHLSNVLVEWASVVDELYMIEVSYGNARMPVARLRFTSGDKNFLPPLQQMRIRALGIPQGEAIYYRMMCGTGGGTCRVSFRYHYHQ